jgi:OmpA-OmpF porin, OOP family
MRLRSALLAATILAAPAIALAQPIDGLYIGGGAGINLLTDQNINNVLLPGVVTNPGSSNSLINSSGNLQSHAGFVGLGAIGWGLGNGLRFELEGNYRKNQFYSNASGNSFPGVIVGGNAQTYGAMVNAVYDFDLGPVLGFPLLPYLGVGVGYGWEHLQSFSFSSSPNPNIIRGSSNQTEGGFAAQGIVGASLPIYQVIPGLALTLEYRPFAVISSNNYSGTIYTPKGSFFAPTGTAGRQFKLGDYFSNSVLVGLRYAFNTVPPPPPPPPPPPVPPVARSYLVFFDWDKATLTTRARQIIHEAADASTHVQYTRIEVNGYTDTSGTPRYNQGLSVRRAEAVAAELVHDGVPRASISIQGFGETHLLVPTGPGVREPQNRRVEIIIR